MSNQVDKPNPFGFLSTPPAAPESTGVAQSTEASKGEAQSGKNPFGFEPTARSTAVPGAVDAASTVGETGTKGDPFGFKRFVEPQVAAPQIVEKAVIDDVSKYVADAIAGGNLQRLLNLDHSHWKKIDRGTLDAIRNALGDPSQEELADQLQGRIGAAVSRLFSEEMKTQ